jgi:RNA polymerase sigma-70 factor (ECF subfamily)
LFSKLRASRASKDPKREAFDAEVLPHLDLLYGNALRLTRSKADAEDLLQETVLRAFRFFDRFERGSNIKAWLLRIQYNLFVNRYRRGVRERDVRETMTHEPSGRDVVSRSALQALTDPDGAALGPLVQKELALALEQLPEDHRTVIVLADIEELSYKEIAEVMGCPIGTVMSRLHRARRSMRERIVAAAEGAPVNHAPPTSSRLSAGDASQAAEPAAPGPTPTHSESEPVSLDAFRRDRRRN